MNLHETLVSILEEFDPGGWHEDPRIDQWAYRLRNAITLPEAPDRQPGYDAVYAIIRVAGTSAWTNALIWRAVEAFADAQERGGTE